MPIEITQLKQCIRQFNFKKLFIEELGWDHHEGGLDIIVDEVTFTLSAIAHKRGLVAYICTNKDIPPYPLRRKIESKTARSVQEHLIIYTDSKRRLQIWQWVKREAGKPAACREHHYYAHQPGDSLAQKLSAIAFSLEEEEGLTIVDITGRVRAGFDVDHLTKRFYDRFKKEHTNFLKFIGGIPDEHLQRWYASVMLNRLMFIYFIQKKGFLNNDTDYLRNKLRQVKEKGKNRFYKDFLCPLFFEGFAKEPAQRSLKINTLLGKIPYLNGGIFQQHEIEQLHGKTINIADKAFEKIFGFFDAYQWHLDERPLRADNEINPDVLGYIFEKYINQKQMGAYYTKEDITGYISRNTVIPRIFDIARQKCKIAFEGEQSVWRLLRENPDRYIFEAVKKGVDLKLPAEIAAGLDDVSKRTEWNKPALEEYALPTEIWREVVARRKRYEEVRSKLANGEISSINDFITYNLDICQFAQDVIENCEGPELLRAIWYAIAGRIPEKSNEKFQVGISILDPACGSGAFLFAALNILESLYEACLDRMQIFLDELNHSGKKHHPEKFADFRKILAEVDKHPNPSYFVYKSIIINNLFGVDIMEEAIEICKLRLFLKLVAQIEKVENIEPLPDIDFNIRAGNTLVGFATYEQVEKAVKSKLDFDNTMAKISEKAQDIDRQFLRFRQQQTKLGGDIKPEDKSKLQARLRSLEDELNGYLSSEYGVKEGDDKARARWIKSHQPFHWFIEFYGIIASGGFDIIIGNPPYVEYRKVKNDYSIRGYKTEKCGNLYPFFVEKSSELINDMGRFSFIILMASISTPRMNSLRNLLTKGYKENWFINLAGDWHPGKLFEGVRSQFTIVTSSKISSDNSSIIYTTNYIRWFTEERNILLSKIRYVLNPNVNIEEGFPKFSQEIELKIWDKIQNKGNSVASYKYKYGSPFYYRNAGIAYYLIVINFRQRFLINGKTETSSTLLKFNCRDNCRDLLVALLNSNLFGWYYFCFSDCYHLTKTDLEGFKIDLSGFSKDLSDNLSIVVSELMQSINQNSIMKMTNYKTKGRVEYQEFYPRKSKHYIDRIDPLLAQHYGFTDEELDYIINYDIKYRMGRELENNENQ